MPTRLETKNPDFSERFGAFLAEKRESAHDVDEAVRGIIADVIARGDEGLVDLSRKFDRVDLSQIGLRVSSAEIDAAMSACDKQAFAALEFARDRIEAYH